MRRRTHVPLPAILAALTIASAVAAAQAPTQTPSQTPPDATLARLERAMTANPGSVKAVRAVGLKYYELKRWREARTTLEHARQLDPKDGLSALYSGLASEELKDYAAAKLAYTRYLQVGKTRGVRNDIRNRLLAMAKQELKEQARQAVSNEVVLRGLQVPGTTVAVLPFRCSCADTSLLPLERGLAELVVTDLSRSANLRVLERDRMQAIADEIALSSTSAVDAATATRAGKLIMAGRILNGQIVAPGGQPFTLAGAIVNTTSGSIEQNPTAAGTIDAIFNLEKSFVLDVFSKLGIQLTVAERREFDKRPTQNLRAFLAFSRGLMAEDAGRLDDAVRFFESARSLDPGFGAALQRAQSAAATQAGAQVSSVKVEQGLRNSSEGQVVAAAQRGGPTTNVTLSATLNNAVGDVNPTRTNTVQSGTSSSGSGTATSTPVTQPRDATAEKTGGDQPAARTAQVTIVIKKP